LRGTYVRSRAQSRRSTHGANVEDMNSPNDPALHVSCGASVCALLRFAPLNDWKYR
jgi:hypothetical protein